MQNGSDERVKIYRFWSQDWEDISYEEEIELTNILCQVCAGYNAVNMTKDDFDDIGVRCYKEIFKKVGTVAGVIPLPVFNNKEYSLLCTIDKYDKEKVWFYVGQE